MAEIIDSSFFTNEPQIHRPRPSVHAHSLPSLPQKFQTIEQQPLRDLPAVKSSADSSNAEFFSSSEFVSLGLNERICSALGKRLNITKPTQIQSRTIPSLMFGRDLLVQSRTGSGKTLAYFLPILADLLEFSKQKHGELDRSIGCLALIIVPTRELATQISSVVSRLILDFPFLVCGSLMGGEKKKSEKSRIRKGINILIATPGRLLDHIENTRALEIGGLRWIVMDEADRLLDLGFEADIKKIVDEIRVRAVKQKIRSILVSATLDSKIQRLAKFALNSPLFVQESAESTASETPEIKNNEVPQFPTQLKHSILEVDSPHRLVAIASILRQRLLKSESVGSHCKSIVFFSTCASVEFHSLLLSRTVWPPKSDETEPTEKHAIQSLLSAPILKLHGSMTQKDRLANFHSFSRSSNGILFCTDVAARGLDLPAVQLVIQADPPEDINDFAHRAGRSARMGAIGESVLLLTPAELDYLPAIEAKFNFNKFEVLALPRLLSALKINCRKAIEELGYPAGALLQREFESLTAGNSELHQLAVSAYQSFIRSYAAYPKSMKSIFHPTKLHFGHVARSFALSEEPGKIKKIKSQSFKKRNNEDFTESHQSTSNKRMSLKSLANEEFAA